MPTGSDSESDYLCIWVEIFVNAPTVQLKFLERRKLFTKNIVTVLKFSFLRISHDYSFLYDHIIVQKPVVSVVNPYWNCDHFYYLTEHNYRVHINIRISYMLPCHKNTNKNCNNYWDTELSRDLFKTSKSPNYHGIAQFTVFNFPHLL